MSTEYHDLSDPESLPSPSPSPTPSRLSPSTSSAPSTSLPVSAAATFVLPQPSSSTAPQEKAPKVSHAVDDPINLAHLVNSGHSPWRLQWKKDNSNWRYSAEDAEDRIARGLVPIRDEATLMRELDKLVNRPPGPVVIAPLRSRRTKAEIDGPWRNEVKEESEGVGEKGTKSEKEKEGHEEESLN